MGYDIEHHESFLGNGRLHTGRFTDDGNFHGREQRQDTRDAVFSRNFFFGRGQINDIVGLFLGSEPRKHLQERHQTSATVVAAQSVEHIAILLRTIGIARPGSHGLHRVEMGIEEQGGTVLVEVGIECPHVVGFATGLESEVADGLLHDVGSLFFATAYGGCGNEVFQQFNGSVGEFRVFHILWDLGFLLQN